MSTGEIVAGLLAYFGDVDDETRQLAETMDEQIAAVRRGGLAAVSPSFEEMTDEQEAWSAGVPWTPPLPPPSPGPPPVVVRRVRASTPRRRPRGRRSRARSPGRPDREPALARPGLAGLVVVREVAA